MAMHLSDHFTYRKLIKAVIPPILMMIFTSLYTIVDGVFISNVVGKEPFAGQNLIWPVISAVSAIGFMLGAGGSALVAKILGEGNRERANQVFSMIVYFTAIVGVILSVVGAVTVEPIAKLLGATENLLPHCVTYGRILLGGMVMFMLQCMFHSFFIVAEKPALGFLITVLSGVANIVFDAIFIVGAKLGLAGAGYGTVLGQCVGTVIPLIYFSVKNKSPLRFVLTKLELKPIVRTCTNGFSELLSNISISVVNMLYNMQLLKYLGENGVNAYGVIQYLSFVFLAIFFGYNIGSAPMISYNYGAQNKEELHSLLKKSLVIVITVGALMTALSEALARPLSMIFVSYDKEMLDITVYGMRIFGVSFVLCGVNILASSFFTALNNGTVSAIISVMRTLVFQIIAIMTLPLLFGIDGIWTSVILAEGLSLIVSAVCFAVCKKKYGY